MYAFNWETPPADWPYPSWNPKTFKPQPCIWAKNCVSNGCCEGVHPGEEGVGLQYFAEKFVQCVVDGKEVTVKQEGYVRLVASTYYERRFLGLSWTEWCVSHAMPAPISKKESCECEESESLKKHRRRGGRRGQAQGRDIRLEEENLRLRAENEQLQKDAGEFHKLKAYQLEQKRSVSYRFQPLMQRFIYTMHQQNVFTQDVQEISRILARISTQEETYNMLIIPWGLYYCATECAGLLRKSHMPPFGYQPYCCEHFGYQQTCQYQQTRELSQAEIAYAAAEAGAAPVAEEHLYRDDLSEIEVFCDV